MYLIQKINNIKPLNLQNLNLMEVLLLLNTVEYKIFRLYKDLFFRYQRGLAYLL